MDWNELGILLVVAFLPPFLVSLLIFVFLRKQGRQPNALKIFLRCFVVWGIALAGFWSSLASLPHSVRPTSPGKPAPRLPDFEWPPPAASSIVSVPLPPQGKQTWKQVDTILTKALTATGYYEIGYFAVPDGFAIVTRIERIAEDGSSFGLPDRWIASPTHAPIKDLSSYLRALFKAPSGYYRVIVFVLSPYSFSQSTAKVSRDDAIAWLSAGANRLPPALWERPYTQDYACTALIYEFVKSDACPVSDVLRPGRLSAMVHLTRSHIYEALK